MASKAERNRAEVAETLTRHGFTPEGVEAVFAFEAEAAKRRRAPKPEPETLW